MTTEIMTASSTTPATDPRTLNLYQKIAAIMGNLDAIRKTGKNTSQGYAFIEQAVIAATLRPMLAEYGLVILPAMTACQQESRTTAKGTTITHTLARTAFTLVNADNPAEAITLDWWGECDDSGDKGVNKTGTSAAKYFLMKLFLISDRDDPDAETSPTASSTSAPATAQAGEGEALSEKQLSAIYAIGYAAGLNKESIAAKSMEAFGYVPEQLTRGEASTFIEQLKTLPQKAKGAPKPTAAARS